MIHVVHTSFHFVSHPWANLHKKCILAKGKKHLNRGSNQPLHPPSPFLASVQMSVFLSKISGFPFTPYCLNIIEPRFEPRTARGRLFPPPTFDLRPSTFDHSDYSNHSDHPPHPETNMRNGVLNPPSSGRITVTPGRLSPAWM